MITFIVAVLVVLIERFLDWSHLRRLNWFNDYQSKLTQRFPTLSPGSLFALSLAPVLIAVLVLSYLLSGHLFGLASFIFQTALVLYCLGPRNLWADAFSSIHLFAQKESKQAVEQAHAAFGIPLDLSAPALHQAFLEAILIQANRRVIAVIIWFLILGPLGAVLYRLLDKMTTSPSLPVEKWASLAIGWMDWVSVRCFGLLLAFVGHFAKAFPRWSSYLTQRKIENNQNVLFDAALIDTFLPAQGIKSEEVDDESLPEKRLLSLIDKALLLALGLSILIVLF